MHTVFLKEKLETATVNKFRSEIIRGKTFNQFIDHNNFMVIVKTMIERFNVRRWFQDQAFMVFDSKTRFVLIT